MTNGSPVAGGDSWFGARPGSLPIGRVVLAVLVGLGIWLARTIADNPVESCRRPWR